MNILIDYLSRYSLGHFCCRVKQGKRLSEFLQKYTDSGTETIHLAGYQTFHSFFATFLYENEAPGLEQAAVVTMTTRVLRPLKRAFLCIPPERLTACKILRGVENFHFPRCLMLTETCS